MKTVYALSQSEKLNPPETGHDYTNVNTKFLSKMTSACK